MHNNHRLSHLGQGIRIARMRRVTGYLVGTLSRFNDAKRAEESQRVKHRFSANSLKECCHSAA